MLSNDQNVARIIDKYFSKPDINKKLHCFFTTQDNFISCGLNKEDLKYKDNSFPDGPTGAQMIVAQASNEPDGKYRISKDKMVFVLKNVEDPSYWVDGLIIENRLEYYIALIEATGGPNALLNSKHLEGSIMHSTIEFWKDEKVDYMLSQKVDLEQRSTLRKETALLVARRADKTSSEYVNMLKLLRHGADPRAVDNRGRGICDYLRKTKSRWDAKFPDARENLIRELKDKHNMVC
jgi:hypothetical protein